MSKIIECFICDKEIKTSQKFFGNRAPRLVKSVSDDGVFIENMWVCNNCAKVIFEHIELIGVKVVTSSQRDENENKIVCS